MPLRLFRSYNMVIPFTSSHPWTPESIAGCLQWLTENDVDVVTGRDGLLLVRMDGNVNNDFLHVECAIPATTTADCLMHRIGKAIPDPWRVNARGIDGDRPFRSGSVMLGPAFDAFRKGVQESP